jgi:hypothetical protein
MATANTTTTTANMNAESINDDARLDWDLENGASIVARMAAELEVHQDNVAFFAHLKMLASDWPALMPEDAGYAQAFEDSLRAEVQKYCKAVDYTKAYLEQSDAAGRYKARRVRVDANGRSYIDFSKGGAAKRARRV